MSFEEKYGHYKKPGRFSAPEGYVDDIAGKISSKISRPRTARVGAWSLSLSAVGILAAGWFLLPLLRPSAGGQPLLAGERTATRSIAYSTPSVSPSRDSGGVFVSVENAGHVSLKGLDRDAIVEYLLDEGYEEI